MIHIAFEARGPERPRSDPTMKPTKLPTNARTDATIFFHDQTT